MDEREWRKWGSFGGNDFLRSGRMDETPSCTRSSSCPAPRLPGRSGSMLDHLSPSPGRSDALAAAPVGLLIVSDLKQGWPPSTGQWLPPFRGEASYFAVGPCSLCLPACLHAPSSAWKVCPGCYLSRWIPGPPLRSLRSGGGAVEALRVYPLCVPAVLSRMRGSGGQSQEEALPACMRSHDLRSGLGGVTSAGVLRRGGAPWLAFRDSAEQEYLRYDLGSARRGCDIQDSDSSIRDSRRGLRHSNRDRA